jgi:hypothetical protein
LIENKARQEVIRGNNKVRSPSAFDLADVAHGAAGS